MQYTDIELIKECIFHYNKLSFSLQEMQSVLITKFGVKSLKYKSLSPEYMRQTIQSLLFLKYGIFDKKDLIFHVNVDSLDLLEVFEEYEVSLKATADEIRAEALKDDAPLDLMPKNIGVG